MLYGTRAQVQLALLGPKVAWATTVVWRGGLGDGGMGLEGSSGNLYVSYIVEVALGLQDHVRVAGCDSIRDASRTSRQKPSIRLSCSRHPALLSSVRQLLVIFIRVLGGTSVRPATRVRREFSARHDT